MADRSAARLLFAECIEGPEELLDLARAAALIALEDDPDRTLDGVALELDRLAEGLDGTFADLAPPAQLRAIAGLLRGEQGFRGDELAYYSPANSLLTRVLERRAGIPITLALVYMEVARRRGARLLPIGLPGHLVLRHALDVDAYLDPFRGLALNREECLRLVIGEGSDRVPAELLEPLGFRPFLLRLLTNLKGAYLRTEPPSLERALAASERIVLLYPGMASELRDRGLLHLQLGHLGAALFDLERYLSAMPDANDASVVHEQAQALYLRLGRLN